MVVVKALVYLRGMLRSLPLASASAISGETAKEVDRMLEYFA